MPPFNVIINFSSCLQCKTNLPCHSPNRKRGGKPISAQAARVSLVTAGSRYSRGSARLNDCALVAFSNPFEINLILSYLQSPSLQSKGSVSSHAGGWITHKQTAGSVSQPGILTAAMGDDKRNPIPPLWDSLHPPEFPGGLSQATFSFSLVQPEFSGPIRKIHPS